MRHCPDCGQELVEVDNPLRREFRHRRGEEALCEGRRLLREALTQAAAAPDRPVPGWDARIEGAEVSIRNAEGAIDPRRNDQLADPFTGLGDPPDPDPAAHPGAPRDADGQPAERPAAPGPAERADAPEVAIRTGVDLDGYVAVIILELDGSTTMVPLVDDARGDAQIVEGKPIAEVYLAPEEARALGWELLGQSHHAESRRRELGVQDARDPDGD